MRGGKKKEKEQFGFGRTTRLEKSSVRKTQYHFSRKTCHITFEIKGAMSKMKTDGVLVFFKLVIGKLLRHLFEIKTAFSTNREILGW